MLSFADIIQIFIVEICFSLRLDNVSLFRVFNSLTIVMNRWDNQRIHFFWITRFLLSVFSSFLFGGFIIFEFLNSLVLLFLNFGLIIFFSLGKWINQFRISTVLVCKTFEISSFCVIIYNWTFFGFFEFQAFKWLVLINNR